MVVILAVLGAQLYFYNKAREPLPGWQRFDVGVGGIYLPQDFEKQWGNQTLHLRQFDSPSMTVYIEWGDGISQGSPPGDSLGEWESRKMTRAVSGLKVNVWVTYSNPEDSDVAERIARAFSLK